MAVFFDLTIINLQLFVFFSSIIFHNQQRLLFIVDKKGEFQLLTCDQLLKMKFIIKQLIITKTNVCHCVSYLNTFYNTFLCVKLIVMQFTNSFGGLTYLYLLNSPLVFLFYLTCCCSLWMKKVSKGSDCKTSDFEQAVKKYIPVCTCNISI